MEKGKALSGGPGGGAPVRGGRSPALRVVLAFVAGLFVLSGGFVAVAPAASAHAVVTSSDPADQSHGDAVPAAVTFKFSEAIDSQAGGLTVLNAKGDRVDQDDSHQPTAETLVVGMKAGLGDGAYVANYAVISADGHPIRGSILFSVGQASLDSVAGAGNQTDPTVAALDKAGQALTYGGTLLVSGLAFFLAVIHDGAGDRRRAVRVARAGAAAAVMGVVVVAVAQCALVTGAGLGSILDGSSLGTVAGTGLGLQDLTLVVGLALCLASTPAEGTTARRFLAISGGLLAAQSFVLWGHARQAPHPLVAVSADMIHLIAAAVWFGGLVGLGVTLSARGRELAALTGVPPSRARAPREADEIVPTAE